MRNNCVAPLLDCSPVDPLLLFCTPLLLPQMQLCSLTSPDTVSRIHKFGAYVLNTPVLRFAIAISDRETEQDRSDGGNKGIGERNKGALSDHGGAGLLLGFQLELPWVLRPSCWSKILTTRPDSSIEHERCCHS